MRYAIISDIHSNLEALEAVLDKIQKKNVDKIFCLGDIIGYGPNPNECIDLVRANCEIIISGNHDFACIESTELLYFNQFARKAIEWTLSEISPENFEFISKLPFVKRYEDMLFVHSNPFQPETWDYIISIDQAIYNFSKFSDNFCFIGHSHYPITFIEDKDGNYRSSNETEQLLKIGSRYIVNVGSVGQPRDGNPDSAFGILDTKDNRFELIRLKYDVKTVHQKMIKIGLPDFLADRLLVGK